MSQKIRNNRGLNIYLSSLHLFLISAVTNSHKFGGLKQCKLLSCSFCRSKVQVQSSSGVYLYRVLQGRNAFFSGNSGDKFASKLLVVGRIQFHVVIGFKSPFHFSASRSCRYSLAHRFHSSIWKTRNGRSINEVATVPKCSHSESKSSFFDDILLRGVSFCSDFFKGPSTMVCDISSLCS